MFTVTAILLIVLFCTLLSVTAVQPKRNPLSMYELERRKNAGSSEASAVVRRETLLPDVMSLQRIKSAFLLVIFVVVSVSTLDWLFGTLLALFVALEYNSLARLPFVQKPANKVYERHEERILHIVERLQPVLRLVRMAQPKVIPSVLSSKAELEHLVEQSSGVLTGNEKKLIINSLGFDEQLVSEIMTPRSVIDSVAKRDHLGPLMLDELHKTGHSRFPVIDGDIDHVVGMLHIQDLLTIDAKRKSTSVEKAMEPRVFYVKADQTLQHALTAFLRTKHHLFIVVNEYRETVGLVSLEDVIESLIGRKIVDEYDAHEDLRMVAARNPHQNNVDKSSTNV